MLLQPTLAPRRFFLKLIFAFSETGGAPSIWVKRQFVPAILASESVVAAQPAISRSDMEKSAALRMIAPLRKGADPAMNSLLSSVEMFQCLIGQDRSGDRSIQAVRPAAHGHRYAQIASILIFR